MGHRLWGGHDGCLQHGPVHPEAGWLRLHVYGMNYTRDCGSAWMSASHDV